MPPQKNPKELFLMVMDKCRELIEDPAFSTVILLCTTGHMAIQSSKDLKQDPTGFLPWLQNFFDYFMIWIYTGAMCLRIMSFGLFYHPNSFLRQPWCYLDLCIVSSAWLNMQFGFGNFMFFMVLRGLKILVDTKIPALSSARGVTKALLNASVHVSVNFFFLLFMMFFFGTLAVQFFGMRGDERSRCSVEFTWVNDQGVASKSWQALMPIRSCLLGTSEDQSNCPNNLVDNITSHPIRCRGPEVTDLDLKSFAQEGFTGLNNAFEDYIPTNFSLWENPSPFTFQNLGEGSLLMFAIFYKTGWVQASEITADHISSVIVVAWAILIAFVNYYLLNLTVAALCLAFSESMKEENSLCAPPPKQAEEEEMDAAEDEDEDNDAEDQENITVNESLRSKIQSEIDEEIDQKLPKSPCCGVWWGPVSWMVLLWCKFAEFAAAFLAKRIPCFRPVVVQNLVKNLYNGIGAVLKRLNYYVIKGVVKMVLPLKDGEYSMFDRVLLIISGIYILALAAQTENFSLYKCGCSELEDMGTAPTCAYAMDPPCEGGKSCVAGKCLTTWAETPCINPWANPALRNLQKAIPSVSSVVASEAGWIELREHYCTYSKFLHFILLGCGFIFLMELCLKFMAHQGPSRFLFNPPRQESSSQPKSSKPSSAAPAPAGMIGKILASIASFLIGPLKSLLNRLHVRNLVDSLCILITVGGIVLTDLTFGVQIFNANISLNYPKGDPSGWSAFKPTTARVIKFARLAMLIRILYHAIPQVQKIAAVAIVIRGCRGQKLIIFACVLLFIFTWFFMLLGRELFLYYGPEEGCNECLECYFDATSPQLICKDTCLNVDFKGCEKASKQIDCSPYICDWKLSGPNSTAGSCVFSASKGGVCQKNSAASHFESNSANFDTNEGGLITLGEVLIGGSWFTDTAAAFNVAGYQGLIYFIIFLYLSSYQLFRLFVAIIAQSFELDEEEKLRAQETLLDTSFKNEKVKVNKREKLIFWDESEEYAGFSFNTHFRDLLRGAQITLQDLQKQNNGLTAEHDTEKPKEPLKEVPWERDDSDDEEVTDTKVWDESEIQKILTINPYLVKESGGAKDTEEKKLPITMRIRNAMKFTVEQSWFNAFLITVVIGSIAVTLIDGVSEDLQRLLSYIFLAVFVLEMVLKMVAYGLYDKSTPGYFNEGWNNLDFFLVCLQIFDVTENTLHYVFQPGDPNANIVKGFRCLRVLRLLSKLSNVGKENPLRGALQALAASMPSIICLIFGLAMYMLCFAIIGMDQFQGVFEACDENGGGPEFGIFDLDKSDCFGNSVRPPADYSRKSTWQRGLDPSQFSFAAPRSWGVPYSFLSFNDIGDSFYTLFAVLQRSTIESLTLSLVSANERDQAPVKGSFFLATLYVIIFEIIGGVFVSQVVIGIILSNLKIKSGLAFHTEDQLRWPATKKKLQNMPGIYGGKRQEDAEAAAPANKIAALLQLLKKGVGSVRDNWKYRLLMVFCVVFSCGAVASTNFGASKQWTIVNFWINFITLIFFGIDVLVQFIPDPKAYFYNKTFLFDFFITALGFAELFIFPTFNINVGLGSLRMFRIFMLVARNVSSVQEMILVVRMSLPQAAAILILLIMLLFIFGVIGTTLFPSVKWGLALRDSSNFQNLGAAMWLLFQASSGQGGRDPTSGWVDYVLEASVQMPYCTPILWLPAKPNYQGLVLSPMGLYGKDTQILPDCGFQALAIPYFFLFMIICNYIILPTFAASVIVSYFEANLGKHSLVGDEDLIKFRDVFRNLMNDSRELKITDPKQDKFDQLLMGLSSVNCSLGFSTSGESYEKAKAFIKPKKRLKYEETAAILIAVREKCRPVTIVEILRRRQAEDMLRRQGGNTVPRRKPEKLGKLHATKGLLEEYTVSLQSKKKKEKKPIAKDNVIYSYNVHVMLDQLRNNSEQESAITEPEFEALRLLVEEDDEDLFIYFEEYVERAGDDIDDKKRWSALQLFARRAKDIAARSKYRPGDGKEKLDLAKQRIRSKRGLYVEPAKEEEEEEEMMDKDQDEDRGASGQVEAPGETGEGEGKGAGVDEGQEEEPEPDDVEGENEDDLEGFYGKQHDVKDAYGGLDLRDWKACDNCRQPVSKKWPSCPSCNEPISRGKADGEEA